MHSTEIKYNILLLLFCSGGRQLIAAESTAHKDSKTNLSHQHWIAHAGNLPFAS